MQKAKPTPMPAMSGLDWNVPRVLSPIKSYVLLFAWYCGLSLDGTEQLSTMLYSLWHVSIDMYAPMAESKHLQGHRHW
jgi:hypothetical protein